MPLLFLLLLLLLTTTGPCPAMAAKGTAAFENHYSLAYNVGSDLAEQDEPRVYTNKLTAGFGTSFLDPRSGDERFSLGLKLGAQYKTLNGEIDTGRRTDGDESSRLDAFELADAEASVSKDVSLGAAVHGNHTLGLNGGFSLPTSRDSRLDGVQGVPFLGAELESAFAGKRFLLTNGLSSFYIMNTYLYSPVTREINPDAGLIYSLSARLRLLKHLTATAGGSVKGTHHLDDSNAMGFGNFQALTFAMGGFSTTLRHSNGSHLSDRDIELWYIDRYRRMVSLNLEYRF